MAGISNTISINEHLPRIVPWPFCCARNRSAPGYDAIRADGIKAALHGQRSGDFPKADTAPLEYPGLELVAPLWTATRAEVQSRVDQLGVELPHHYGEHSSSLDCSVCPSSLITKRREWMARRYPNELMAAEELHGAVTKAVLAALDGDNTKNAYKVQ